MSSNQVRRHQNEDGPSHEKSLGKSLSLKVERKNKTTNKETCSKRLI